VCIEEAGTLRRKVSHIQNFRLTAHLVTIGEATAMNRPILSPLRSYSREKTKAGFLFTLHKPSPPLWIACHPPMVVARLSFVRRSKAGMSEGF